MTTKELINQYVTAHADNRWMDASELEALLTEFAEKLKEPVSEDLEKFVDKYALTAKPDDWIATNDGSATPVFFMSSIRDAMKCSAQWQRERMMKDAVEGPFIRRNRYTKKNVLNNFDLTHDALQNFKDGQKLKVIFVPSDNK